MAETKIASLIGDALDDIRTVLDANTIIGTPIETNAGTTIIPVSKVSVGIASGGVDYDSKKNTGNNNFGGGGGTGMQVVPVAFLVVHQDGSVEMMNVSNPVSKPADIGYNISSLVDRAPEIIEKIKAIFTKKKKDGSQTSGGKQNTDSAIPTGSRLDADDSGISADDIDAVADMIAGDSTIGADDDDSEN